MGLLYSERLQKGKAICNKCKSVLSNVDEYTTGMAKHLNVKHGINIQKNPFTMSASEDEPSKKTTKTIITEPIIESLVVIIWNLFNVIEKLEFYSPFIFRKQK